MDKELKKRVEEVEQQLRELQKAWIIAYEKVIRLINDAKEQGIATNYTEDQEHDND